MTEFEKGRPTLWQQWRDRPEQVWLRNAMFQIHFWVGAVVGGYIFLMSVSGSLLVYHNKYAETFSAQWLVDFHTNLLGGSTGRLVNGIGALSLLLVSVTGAVIWWPGIKHWRRSLTVEWSARFPRLNWDLHSARLLVLCLRGYLGPISRLFCVPSTVRFVAAS